MVWTAQHTAKSHQAKVDRKVLPIMRELRKRGCAYRHTAALAMSD